MFYFQAYLQKTHSGRCWSRWPCIITVWVTEVPFLFTGKDQQVEFKYSWERRSILIKKELRPSCLGRRGNKAGQGIGETTREEHFWAGRVWGWVLLFCFSLLQSFPLLEVQQPAPWLGLNKSVPLPPLLLKPQGSWEASSTAIKWISDVHRQHCWDLSPSMSLETEVLAGLLQSFRGGSWGGFPWWQQKCLSSIWSVMLSEITMKKEGITSPPHLSKWKYCYLSIITTSIHQYFFLLNIRYLFIFLQMMTSLLPQNSCLEFITLLFFK